MTDHRFRAGEERGKRIRRVAAHGYVAGKSPAECRLSEADYQALREELGATPFGKEELRLYAPHGVVRIYPDEGLEVGRFQLS